MGAERISALLNDSSLLDDYLQGELLPSQRNSIGLQKIFQERFPWIGHGGLVKLAFVSYRLDLPPGVDSSLQSADSRCLIVTLRMDCFHRTQTRKRITDIIEQEIVLDSLENLKKPSGSQAATDSIRALEFSINRLLSGMHARFLEFGPGEHFCPGDLLPKENTIICSTTEQADIQDFLYKNMREGFLEADEIITSAHELFGCQPDDTKRHAFIMQQAQTLCERQRKEQETWSIPTDCDRLDRAFGKLEKSGILGRQNFSCCLTCGHAEIQAEIQSAQFARSVWGFVFYHQQDTERAVQGEGLWLAFGSVCGGEAWMQKAGLAITNQLRLEGLLPEWDGDTAKRIFVPIQWRRRLRFSSLSGALSKKFC